MAGPAAIDYFMWRDLIGWYARRADGILVAGPGTGGTMALKGGSVLRTTMTLLRDGDCLVIKDPVSASSTAANIDLGTTPGVMTNAKMVKIWSYGQLAGQNNPRAHSWIKCDVAGAGALQFHDGVAGLHLEGFAVENPSGMGVEIYQNWAKTRVLDVGAINCLTDGIHFRGNTGDGSYVGHIASSGCGVSLAFRPEYNAGADEWRSPNNVEIHSPWLQDYTTAALVIERKASVTTGGAGARGFIIEGIKTQGSIKKGIQLFGARDIKVGLGAYFEEQCPTLYIRQATDGVITDKGTWSGAIKVDGGSWINSNAAGTDAQYIDADACHALKVEDAHFAGAVGTYSTTNPAVRLGSHSQNCRVHFECAATAGMGNFVDAIDKLVQDAGTANGGTWWDPAGSGTLRYWGTQPV